MTFDLEPTQPPVHRASTTLCRGACLIPLTLFAFLAGCGSRTPLPDEPGCYAAEPTCVAPPPDSPSGACAAQVLTAASCDVATRAWSCPEGSRVYERAPDSQDCRPFEGAGGMWGLGGFSRVPTDDGRCLWIADSATTNDGTTARNVAFVADPTAPFGTCPTESVTAPIPVVILAGGDDPSILVQIDGGYRLGGVTHVLYRLFQMDPTSPVGVRETGGGVARWDAPIGRIVVPAPTAPAPWGLDLDLGDAFLADADGTHELVFGCAQPGLYLERGCELARLDANDTVELWSNGGSWVRTTDSSMGATLFGSGPWTSSVVPSQGSLRHVYVSDFGSTLQTHVAAAATGPWSDGPTLGACDLPASDPHAYCGGATVHPEISDPTRPGELPITYGVGSTGAPVGSPSDYSTRLVWLR